MDALILRIALLLSLAPSTVCAMQATDVLALAVADARSREESQLVRDLTAVRDASLINLAVFAPDKLATEEQKIRDRAGLVAPPAPATAFEALAAAMPLVDA